MGERDPRDVKIPFTRRDLLVEVIAAAGILITLGVILAYWPQLPDRIPTHYGFSGQPDAWGGKGIFLFIIAVAGGLYTLMTIVTRYPKYFNIPWEITERNAVAQLSLAVLLIRVIKAEIAIMFMYITWKTIRVATGAEHGLGNAFVLVTMVIVFGTLGLYFWRSSRIEEELRKNP